MKNVLIINPDSMRADSMKHLGNEAAYTPNLDELAKEGVSFRNAFCQNTVCVPSRCSFMTGLYCHTHGHRTMNYLLRNGEDNLFSDMKSNGYYTVSSTRGDLMDGEDRKYHKACIDEYIKIPKGSKEFGKSYALSRGDKDSDTYYSFLNGSGVIDSDDVVKNLDDLTVDGAINSIKRRPKDKPFFMFVGINAPHPEYFVEKKFYDLIDKSKLQPRIPSISKDDGKPKMEKGLRDIMRVGDWDEERLKHLRAVYLGMCAKVDYLTGLLVDTLKSEGIYDDTMIIFMSDHGDYTGDFGIVEKCQNCFPDCLTNVPFIIKPCKGERLDCGVNDNLVELTDMTATIWEEAGIKPNFRTQFGNSLFPMMKDESLSLRDVVFCEGGRNPGERMCVENTREGSPYYARHTQEEQEDGRHGKAVMVRSKEFKYVYRLYEQDELYVLSIGESKNLIEDEKYAGVVLAMKEKALEWLVRTCDEVPAKRDSRFTNEFMYNNMRAMGASPFVILGLKFYFNVLHKSPMDLIKKHI